MNTRLKISTQTDQLREGLFGQIFLWVFELLPYFDRKRIFPAWAIRSTLYGTAADFLVIPGLLEINYDTSAENYQDVNLQDLRDRHAATLGSDWDYAAALWHKYFRWPERVIQRADQFPRLDQALGIHYRGTDKNKSLVETNFVSQENFLELVQDFVETHPNIDAIYAATDENSFIEKLRAQHPSLQVVNSGIVTHHKSAAGTNSSSKGDHALLDCWLLSRCKYLLKCQSALSGFAKVLNPQLDAYRVSASKLPYWSWGIPYFPDAYLPKLTSRKPECQRILAELLAGDWTEDPVAMMKFGHTFQHKTRKGYVRKAGGVSKWSLDGLQQRLDSRLDRIARKLHWYH